MTGSFKQFLFGAAIDSRCLSGTVRLQSKQRDTLALPEATTGAPGVSITMPQGNGRYLEVVVGDPVLLNEPPAVKPDFRNTAYVTAQLHARRRSKVKSRSWHGAVWPDPAAFSPSFPTSHLSDIDVAASD